jgi:hypothetical protein
LRPAAPFFTLPAAPVPVASMAAAALRVGFSGRGGRKGSRDRRNARLRGDLPWNATAGI